MTGKTLILIIGAATLWGFTPILEKLGLGKGVSAMNGVVIRSSSAALGAIIFTLLNGTTSSIFNMPLKNFVFIALSGITAGLVAQWLYFSSLKASQTSLVVPIGSTYPLFTLIFSVIILNESFSTQKLVGILLIISGVFLLGF